MIGLVICRNKGEDILKKMICIAAVSLLTGLYACAAPAEEAFAEETEKTSDGITDGITDNTAEDAETGSKTDSREETDENMKAPKVFIDLNGYCPGDEKTAYFLGSEETGTFHVVDKDTRKEVYKGVMTAASYQNEAGEFLLKGDFSAVKEEGNYYIEVPGIGRSYTFTIREEHFQAVYDNLEKALWEETADPDGEFLYRVQAFLWLLRYQEYYGNMTDFPEQAEALGESLISEKPEELTEQELAYYCAAMAQLYETVKEYDVREANIFLREAESAYKLLESRQYGESFDEVWLFYDGAVLFKATGYVKYHNVVKSYLKDYPKRDFYEDNASEEQLLADEAYVYGAVAYLTTVSNVDVNLCDSLMKQLTEKAESMEAEHDANPFMCVSSDRRNRLLSDRLYVVTVVEHVVVSKEYVQILEDGIHYINGCNETGASFLTGKGVLDNARDEKGSDMSLGGAYLFILGDIIESEEAE